MEALVSVIMNCFNGEKYLKEAIDSVLNQTYSNWEIILWDNQSTDNSEGIVKSFNDNRIKYFYSEEFTILGEARNRALSKAQGEFIAILDCDDLWYPTKLEKQLMAAARECGYGRVLAGFHYLQDYVVGNLLAEKLYILMNKSDYGLKNDKK